MTNKYTLILDGNFFLHKTYFIGQKIKKGKPFNFIDEPEQDKNLLLWKLSVDFASEIKRFEGITNRIVYAVDSNSWRKTFYPESDYKSNRIKSSDIDWSKIYEVHNEFIASLEKMGVVISRIKGAEADDLIFAWSSYLNQIGQNSLIISGDNDLLQLVNRDKSSGANTIYYNKFDKNLHTFPDFKEWLNTEELSHDIFNIPVDIMSNAKQNLRDIIKHNKMKLEEVNTSEFIFTKILIGDAGDNVTPICVKYKEGKNGTRKFTVTQNQAKQVLDEYISNKSFVNQAHLFNEEYIEYICNIAKRIIKIEKPIDEIKEKWKINRNLVYLHKKCIPEEIFIAMFSHLEETPIKSFSAKELYSLMNKDEILKETSYSKEMADSFNESQIFKNSLKNEHKKEEVVIVQSENKGFDSTFWEDLLK